MTVFTLGLDGASLENIRNVMKKTKLPNFEKVLNNGSAYDLRSIYPYVTGPAWASIFSGVNPGKHGIFDQVESDGESLHAPNLNNSDVPFLWDYLSWAGKKILVMGVQFVHPSPQVNGIFVTGRFSPRVYCYPENVKDHVDLSGYDHTELGNAKWKYIKKFGIRSLWERNIELLRRRIAASLSLIDSAIWDSVILVDCQPDDLFHSCFGNEEIMKDLFQTLDGWLGELIKRLKSGDALLILSDHGFSSVTACFLLDEWLHSKGYLSVKGQTRLRLLRKLDRELAILDRVFAGQKTHRFIIRELKHMMRLRQKPRTTSQFIEANRKMGSRVVPFVYNEQFAWLKILAKSKEGRERTISSVVRDAEDLKRLGVIANAFQVTDLYDGKQLPKAPGDILMELSEGFCLKPGADRAGTHRRNGMVVFYGSVTPKENIQPVLYDIVPTVLRIMRIPCPRYVEGKALV